MEDIEKTVCAATYVYKNILGEEVCSEDIKTIVSNCRKESQRFLLEMFNSYVNNCNVEIRLHPKKIKYDESPLSSSVSKKAELYYFTPQKNLLNFEELKEFKSIRKEPISKEKSEIGQNESYEQHEEEKIVFDQEKFEEDLVYIQHGTEEEQKQKKNSFLKAIVSAFLPLPLKRFSEKVIDFLAKLPGGNVLKFLPLLIPCLILAGNPLAEPLRYLYSILTEKNIDIDLGQLDETVVDVFCKKFGDICANKHTIDWVNNSEALKYIQKYL